MRRIEYVIDELSMILNNTACLNLVPKNKGAVIKFRPGQYGLISFLRGYNLSSERPFSFAGSALNQEALQFGFRVYGKFTSEVAQLKKGDSVFVRGPFGSFIFNEKKHKDTVFLAAGIGITPFLSAIRYASEKSLPNKMTLIYSNQFENEIPFYRELKQLEAKNPKFKSYFLVSRPDESLNRKLFIPGRISESLVLTMLNGKITGKTFFICGPEPFIIAAIDLLKELGVEEKYIKTEGFSQIPISFFEKGTSFFPFVAGTSALITLAAFVSINQMEVTKATIKSQNAQAYSQQLLAEHQAAQSLAQSQDAQQLSVQQYVQPPAIQVQQSPVQPKVATTVKKTTVASTPKTTTVKPKVTVSKPKPVYTAPVTVYTPPVYTPPPIYIPPSPPVQIYTPSPRTTLS